MDLLAISMKSMAHLKWKWMQQARCRSHYQEKGCQVEVQAEASMIFHACSLTVQQKSIDISIGGTDLHQGQGNGFSEQCLTSLRVAWLALTDNTHSRSSKMTFTMQPLKLT
jgi:hypothetical protein